MSAECIWEGGCWPGPQPPGSRHWTLDSSWSGNGQVFRGTQQGLSAKSKSAFLILFQAMEGVDDKIKSLKAPEIELKVIIWLKPARPYIIQGKDLDCGKVEEIEVAESDVVEMKETERRGSLVAAMNGLMAYVNGP